MALPFRFQYRYSSIIYATRKTPKQLGICISFIPDGTMSGGSSGNGLPKHPLSAAQVQEAFAKAMNGHAGSENTPGADGNRIYGTSTKPEFDASVSHKLSHSACIACPGPNRDPGRGPPKPSVPPRKALESNMQIASNSEKASLFHLCYFAEAIYASAALEWRYGHPDPIAQLPASPRSRFRLTVEARTNICSPSYGTPWPEIQGCIAQDIFLQTLEVLYGQVQVAFVLRKASEPQWRHDTGNPSLSQQYQQQSQQQQQQQQQQQRQQQQQQQQLPQLTTLEPLYYTPKFFNPTDDPFTRGRVACGTPIDHQHPAQGIPYPAALALGGYLSAGNEAERARQLLAAGEQTSIRELALPNGLIAAVKAQLREALRWGMAAELLGRLPALGEPLVLDETEFAALEPEFEAAVAPLNELTFLTSLILALQKLREKALKYEEAKYKAVTYEAAKNMAEAQAGGYYHV